MDKTTKPAARTPQQEESYRIGYAAGGSDARNSDRALIAECKRALQSLDRQVDVLMTWTREDMTPLTAVCARDNQAKARAALAAAEQHNKE